MPRSHVLRIPRSDDDDGSSFVLVHVTPSNSKKARPLDVKVVATEGEYPYVVSLNHSGIADLKSSGSPCSAEEWEHILESVLLEREVLEDIQLTAAVRSGLEITVRKKVQRITQRLGTISLKKNEDEEDSDVTEWCGIAIESREELKGELASARAKVQELEQAVSALGSQLEELIGAKRDHETALLHRFRALLNEKKAKIREQEHVIRQANIDTAALEPTQSSRRHSADPVRAPVASRRPKRKVPANQPVESDGSGDDLKAMDLDVKAEDMDDGGNLSEDQHTTDGGVDDDTTASEPDGEAIVEKARAAGKTGKNDNNQSNAATRNQSRASEAPSALPSRRAMPPTTRGQRASDKAPTKAPVSADAGSETESDDEL